jgi:hypothetical protein
MTSTREPGAPLRVLTWHVHGSYLWYLSHVPVTWLLPVRPERSDGYGGRGETFDWPDNVVEVPADRCRELDVDLVLTQHRRNWDVDRHELLGDRVAALPRVHVEHDPPPSWPNDALHPGAGRGDDAGARHAVQRAHVGQRHHAGDGRRPRRARAGPAVDRRDRGRDHRGQQPLPAGPPAGPDVFDDVAAQVPVDLAGMNGDAYRRWLGDVRLRELHARLPSYRAFFNPIRYTSLGLAVCEAMALGLPVVGLATTEMASAVQNGVNGYVETDPRRLAGHLRRLLADRDEAAALSAGAKRVAAERFGIERFVTDWLEVLEAAVPGAAAR